MPRALLHDETDVAISSALVGILPGSRWSAVQIARAYIAWLGKDPSPERTLYESGAFTLRASRDLVQKFGKLRLISFLEPRKRTGSAENPITKLFPAIFAEQLFREDLERLKSERPSVDYRDDRYTQLKFRDFTLFEGDAEVPINVKNAGTRFLNAQSLVGLSPDDCVPIPAYKAHGAIEAQPSLIYAVCPDYELTGRLERELPDLLTGPENIVWELLNHYSGSLLRDAEDAFVSSIAGRHWDRLKRLASNTSFSAISARKAIRVLQTKPERTPGIGLRAWGTSARGEMNVHLSISEDMTRWGTVAERITANGLSDIVSAVNRKRQEWVYDPEI